MAAIEELAAVYDDWQAEYSASLVKENPAVRRLYDVLAAAVREGRIEEADLEQDTLHEVGSAFLYWPRCEKYLLQDGAHGSSP